MSPNAVHREKLLSNLLTPHIVSEEVSGNAQQSFHELQHFAANLQTCSEVSICLSRTVEVQAKIIATIQFFLRLGSKKKSKMRNSRTEM